MRDPWKDPVPSDIAARGTATTGREPIAFTPGGTPILPTGGGPYAGGGALTLPPYYVRPPVASDMNRNASGTGFTALNTPAVLPGSVFQLPPDNIGIIRSVVLSVNTLLVTSSLFWRIRFNAVPVSGWDALTVFPRAAGSVSEAYGPEETFIFVPVGGTIDILIDVTDAGTYQAGASYHGWYYDPSQV